MTEPPPKPAREIAPYELRAASEVDEQDIERLYDEVFGPGRFAKTAERLREGNHRIEAACFVASDAGGLLGSVQFWPLMIGGRPGGVLRRTLATAPRHRGEGGAVRLLAEGDRGIYFSGRDPDAGEELWFLQLPRRRTQLHVPKRRSRCPGTPRQRAN